MGDSDFEEVLPTAPNAAIDQNKLYMHGSIRKIRMVNFMVCENTTIEPGPRCNFIFGPNGNGKSTIVCAIGLGLGGDPKYLGRGDHPSNYVNNQKSSIAKAEIHMTLHNAHGGKHADIRCEIPRIAKEEDRTGDNRKFWFNKEPLSKKAFKDKVATFNIQIDNAIQFLPQDKVQEIVKMDDKGRLRATLNATKGPEFTESINVISGLQKTLSEKLKVINASQARMDELEQRKNTYARDKTRYEAWVRHRAEYNLIALKLLWAEFYEARDKCNQALALRDAKVAEYEQAAARLPRMEAEMKEAEQSLEINSKEIKVAKEAVKAATKKVEDAIRQLDSATDKCDETIAEIEQVSDNIKRARTDRKSVESLLQDAKEKLRALEAKGPDESMSEEAFKTQQDALIVEKDKLKAEKTRITGEMNEVQSQLTTAENNMKLSENDLGMLKQAGDRRLNELKRINPNAAKCYDFIQTNLSKFKGTVYGPVCLAVMPHKGDYVRYTERVLGRSVFAFIVENDEDRNFIFKEQKTNKSFQNIEVWVEKPHSEDVPLPSRSAFSTTVVERFLDSCFDAPDVVKKAINKHSKMHLQIVGAIGVEGQLKANLQRTLEPLFAANLNFVSLHTPKTHFSSSKSRYGDNAMTTEAKEYKKDSILHLPRQDKDIPALEERVKGLRKELEQLRSQKGKLGSDLSKVDARIQSLNDQVVALKTKRDAVKKFDTEVKKKQEAVKRNKANLQLADETLRKLERDGDASIRADLKKKNAGRVLCLEKVVAALGDLSRIAREGDLIQIDISKYKKRLDEARTAFSEEKERVSLFLRERQLAADAYHQCELIFKEKHKLAEADDSKSNGIGRGPIVKKYYCSNSKKHTCSKGADREACKGREPQMYEGDWVQAMMDAVNASWVVEDIRAAMLEAQASVDTTRFNDVNVKEYEKAVREWEEKSKSHGQKVTEFEKDRDAANKQLDNFRVDLDNIMKKIHVNFKKFMADIGCGGEVKLNDSDPDHIDTWGITVSVNFRDTSSASAKLDSKQQSGGEKGISTIMYLLALQSYTIFPFRLVDEINAGMDPIFERKMYQRLLKSVTGGLLPQYFLITPKVLPDLDYNEPTEDEIANGAPIPEDIKIHIVYRGVGLEADNLKTDRMLEYRGKEGASSSKKRQHNGHDNEDESPLQRRRLD